ncbi:hypothetical protein D9M68_923070 [compost metagenome]
MLALGIGEAGAQPETHTLGCLHEQCAHAGGMSALAGQVREHACFGVFVGFHLQQVVAAHCAVERVAPVQHQAFAAVLHHAVQSDHQLGVADHAFLRHDPHPGAIDFPHEPLVSLDAFGERPRVRGQVEHHEADP